ncbi:MAG: hypothetical protein MUP76_07260 [Acidimicrobiia bacterium]|nr:hypothetical protein [Acidimicrobiia bacterium]
MRPTALLAAAALLAACSGDTTTPESTTSATPQTTTTAPLPVIDVGTVPAMPQASLTAQYGGPLVIETVCIDADYTPGVAAPGEIEDSLTQTVGFVGIDTAESGCDLTLGIQFDGHRQSARYEVAGQCYVGAILQGQITATAAGQTWQWEVDIDVEPPDQILDCEGDAAPPGGPIHPDYWQQRLAEPLIAMLGPLGVVGVAAGLTGHIDLNGELPETVTYEILTAALNGDDPDHRCRAVTVVNALVPDVRSVDESDSPWPQDSRLLALAPHLINTYLELTQSGYLGPDPRGGDCEYLLVDALERMTGAYPGNTATKWYEWWTEIGKEWLEGQGE